MRSNEIGQEEDELPSKFQFIQVIPKSGVLVEEDTNQGVDDQENRKEKFEHGGNEHEV
jgi:hypothetical protein